VAQRRKLARVQEQIKNAPAEQERLAELIDSASESKQECVSLSVSCVCRDLPSVFPQYAYHHLSLSNTHAQTHTHHTHSPQLHTNTHSPHTLTPTPHKHTLTTHPHPNSTQTRTHHTPSPQLHTELKPSKNKSSCERTKLAESTAKLSDCFFRRGRAYAGSLGVNMLRSLRCGMWVALRTVLLP